MPMTETPINQGINGAVEEPESLHNGSESGEAAGGLESIPCPSISPVITFVAYE